MEKTLSDCYDIVEVLTETRVEIFQDPFYWLDLVGNVKVKLNS